MYEEFLRRLSDLLEIENKKLILENQLENFQYWDSLAKVTTIGLIDECFGVTINSLDIEKCMTIQDILVLIEKHRAKS
jgi:acyl carrier protein